MRTILNALAFAVVTVTLASLAQPASPGLYVGCIWEMRKGGEISISNTATRVTTHLRQNTARFWPVYEFDYLRCAPGTWVTLTLRYGTQTTNTYPNWTRVPPEPDPLTEDSRVRKAVLLVEALKPTERPRAARKMPIFQPADKSAIRLAGKMVIRWTPKPGVERLALSLRSGTDVVWQTDVDATTGKSEEPELRERLIRARDSGRTNFVLQCQLDATNFASNKFSILSAADERRLAKELADLQADPSEDAARSHLVRAALLEHYGLLNEVTDEYEEAIRCLGDVGSIPLLDRASSANQIIGNVRRGGQLLDLLRRLDALNDIEPGQ